MPAWPTFNPALGVTQRLAERQSLERMTPAVGATFDVIKAGRLSHDGTLLLRHVLSAMARYNERGFTLSKSRSRDRIDAAVAMCMAVYGAEQPAPPPPPAFFVY